MAVLIWNDLPDCLATNLHSKIVICSELRSFFLSSFLFIATAWEQRRLGEEFDFIPNNTLSRADLNNESGEIQSVHYGDILIKYGSVLDAKNDDISFITDGNRKVCFTDLSSKLFHIDSRRLTLSLSNAFNQPGFLI